MATTQDVNVGTFIRYNGDLCVITEWQHRTPGNLRAFYQAKMRNLINGKQIENRFRSGEGVDIVRVDFKQMQYIYQEGDFAVVMDKETFEQVYVPLILFGDSFQFLKEEMEVKISLTSSILNMFPMLLTKDQLIHLKILFGKSNQYHHLQRYSKT